MSRRRNEREMEQGALLFLRTLMNCGAFSIELDPHRSYEYFDSSVLNPRIRRHGSFLRVGYEGEITQHEFREHEEFLRELRVVPGIGSGGRVR